MGRCYKMSGKVKSNAENDLAKKCLDHAKKFGLPVKKKNSK